MKTIQFTGAEHKIENLHLALGISDNDMPQQSETRVYVVNQEDTTTEVEELTDEEFVEIAEEWGRVYTLQGFQDTFNKEKDEVSHSEDFIRFINQPIY
jgi:uncharacterized protein (DUF2164 family)